MSSEGRAAAPATARRRGSAGETAIVCIATLACLLPFLGKAVHLDDPMYLWAARQIQVAPLDFYGLEVNWHGYRDSMAWSNKNPPGVSFYLALVSALLGWNEIALHAGMLLPALALILGTHRLARHLSPQPLLAALAVVAMPAWLVSSTTLMADVPMAALWCWAVVLWIEGLERRRGARLWAGAALVGLAILTKYLALALLPLLLAYGLFQRRRLGRWALPLVLPVAMAAGFQASMSTLYGEGAPFQAALYALATRAKFGAVLLEKAFVTLAFLGGSMLSVLFYLPRLASRRAATATGAALVAAIVVLALWPGLERVGVAALRPGGRVAWLLIAQLALFAAVGGAILALAVRDLHRRRDAGSLLLACWLGGIFAFAALFNWSTNARALLPAAPAVAVLLARRLGEAPVARGKLYAPLAPGLALALAVGWADYRLAGTARTAAAELAERHAPGEGALWFQGAWGFQWYMQQHGGRRTDFRDTALRPGDVMIVPANNSNLWQPPPGAVRLIERARYPAGGWIATLATPVGAGFYSDAWGPLPFALGPAPPEVYTVFAVERPLRLPDAVAGRLGRPGGNPR